MHTLARIWLLLCLTLCVAVPFLDKAFHIDDISFLAVAEQIQLDPFRPHSRMFDRHGNPDFLFGVSSAPLISYYYTLIMVGFGDSEIALHLGMMLFYLLLFIGTHFLSARFCPGSNWPLLFVAFSPATLVSGNLMMDVPAAGLGVLAVALFVLGSDRNSAQLLVSTPRSSSYLGR